MTVYRSALLPALALTLLAACGAASAQQAASAAGAASAPAGKTSAKAVKKTKAASEPAAETKTEKPSKSSTKATAKGRKPTAKPEPKPPEPVVLPEATPEQVSAAEKVYYGTYACEFNQSINIAADVKHFGYVELKMAKDSWTMKPVLSSTGAIRLEDVTGETLMVQISSKSMLLNVRTGHRIVDDCISAKQRELIEAARAAKAAEAAAAAASAAEAASAPK